MGKDVSMSEVSMVCLATHDDLNMWLWELAAKGYVFSKYARERILRIITDDGLRSYAERILPLFNQTVQAVYNSPDSPSNLLRQGAKGQERCVYEILFYSIVMAKQYEYEPAYKHASHHLRELYKCLNVSKWIVLQIVYANLLRGSRVLLAIFLRKVWIIQYKFVTMQSYTSFLTPCAALIMDGFLTTLMTVKLALCVLKNHK